MQLNVYIPKGRERVLAALERAAAATGRQKNDLVIEALDEYLKRVVPEFRAFHLGEVRIPPRGELYERRPGA